jgi:hypothetical protein
VLNENCFKFSQRLLIHGELRRNDMKSGRRIQKRRHPLNIRHIRRNENRSLKNGPFLDEKVKADLSGRNHSKDFARTQSNLGNVQQVINDSASQLQQEMSGKPGLDEPLEFVFDL